MQGDCFMVGEKFDRFYVAEDARAKVKGLLTGGMFTRLGQSALIIKALMKR